MFKKYGTLIIVLTVTSVALLVAVNKSKNATAQASEVQKGNLAPVTTSTTLKTQIKVTAWVTWYTEKENCLFHDKQGRCIDSDGTPPVEGRNIACPYKYALKTKVEIDGHTYTCLSRTAKWAQNFGHPTFDIFIKSVKQAKKNGRQLKEVLIIQ